MEEIKELDEIKLREEARMELLSRENGELKAEGERRLGELRREAEGLREEGRMCRHMVEEYKGREQEQQRR